MLLSLILSAMPPRESPPRDVPPRETTCRAAAGRWPRGCIQTVASWLTAIRLTAIQLTAIRLTAVLLSASLLSGPGAAAEDTSTSDPAAGETDPVVLGLYQDASNFQTNAAFDLAIESWNRLIDEHRESPLVGKAAHYLGVCHMQTQPPDLSAAAAAFEKAVASPANELRPESLINAGYCFFALGQDAAGESPAAGDASLKRSIELHQQLVDSLGGERFADQANFYIGEAAYALGDLAQAVDAYQRILKTDGESKYRCDAAYAAGIALEDLGRTEEAVAAYEKFLGRCDDSVQTADVLLRLGDLLQTLDRHEDAKSRYQEVAKLDPNLADDEDRAYAALQRGVVLSAQQQYPKAAAIYEAILNRYPDTEMAPVARFAAAKTLYLTGQNDRAAVRFAEVLRSPQDVAQATEAAHWLARIQLAIAEEAPTVDGGPVGESPLTDRGDQAARQAAQAALQRIIQGTDGTYAEALRLDAAEALSFLPDRLDEAAARFDSLYADGPTEDLAARALYQGAFVKLQLQRYDESVRDAATFKQRFASHRLYPEAVAVLAEAAFLDGNYELAAREFTALLSDPRFDQDPGRDGWVMRAASALGRDDQHREVLTLLDRELPRIDEPAKKSRSAPGAWRVANGVGSTRAGRPNVRRQPHRRPGGFGRRPGLPQSRRRSSCRRPKRSGDGNMERIDRVLRPGGLGRQSPLSARLAAVPAGELRIGDRYPHADARSTRH